MEFKGTKGKWSYDINANKGFDVYLDGSIKTIATLLFKDVSYMPNEIEAKANAKLIASAPEMFKELKETITDLKILRNQIEFESKSNHLFQGMSELMDKWIERKQQLLTKITSND